VNKVYFQLHASFRFVSLFNVEAALTAQMSPAPAVRPTGIFPGVPAGQSTTGAGMPYRRVPSQKSPGYQTTRRTEVFRLSGWPEVQIDGKEIYLTFQSL